MRRGISATLLVVAALVSVLLRSGPPIFGTVGEFRASNPTLA